MSDEAGGSAPPSSGRAGEVLDQLHFFGRLNLVLTLLLLLVFVVMGFWVYGFVKREYTADRFLNATQKALAELPEPTLEALKPALQDHVLPAFQREIEREFKERRANLEKVLRGEVVGFGEEMEHFLRREVQHSLLEALAAHRSGIEKDFPEIASEQGRAELRKYLNERVNEEMGAILTRMWSLFRADVEKFHAEALALAADMGEKNESELEREFVHLWLMLADHQLMHGRAPAEGRAPVGGVSR